MTASTPRSLQELVAEERSLLALTLKQVADRSRGKTNASTVHAIEQGRRRTITDVTAEGLALGLSLPLQTVLDAAGMATSDVGKPFKLPRRADRLTQKERDHVLELVDLLLARRSR